METNELAKVYEDGEIIVHQGEVGNCMYAILDGQVEVIYEKDGTEIQLTKLGSGYFFGEMALLGPNIRSATVRALGQVRLLTIDKKTFLRRMRSDPSLCLNILRQMSRRIKELGDDLVRYANSGHDLNDKRRYKSGNELIKEIGQKGQKIHEDIEQIIRGMEWKFK